MAASHQIGKARELRVGRVEQVVNASPARTPKLTLNDGFKVRERKRGAQAEEYAACPSVETHFAYVFASGFFAVEALETHVSLSLRGGCLGM